MSGERWVVRDSKARHAMLGWYKCVPSNSWEDGWSPCQSDAIRYDVGEAATTARDVGGRRVRLVSRAEAVARARAAALEEAARMLEAGAIESDEDAAAERREGRDTLRRIFESNAAAKRFYATRIRAMVKR